MGATANVGLLGAVEEALSASMIEELPSTMGRYQFDHVLIQETLAGGLSSVRRVELHARIGEVLEELYGASIEAHADELAYHFLRVNTFEKAVKYTLKVAGSGLLASAKSRPVLTSARVDSCLLVVLCVAYRSLPPFPATTSDSVGDTFAPLQSVTGPCRQRAQ